MSRKRRFSDSSIELSNYEKLFDENKTYKVRLQFSNSIVLYGHLNAYKEKHAMILGVADQMMENIAESAWIKIEFVGVGGKKFTTKFSLRGAMDAIEAVIARANQDKPEENPWFLSASTDQYRKGS